MTAHALQEPYIPLMERVHQGTVKRFNSEAEMKASYSASRKRCFNAPKARKLPLKGTRPPKVETVDFSYISANDAISFDRSDLLNEIKLLKAKLEQQRKEEKYLPKNMQRPTVKQIIADTAREYCVPVSAIIGRSKSTLFLNARREAMTRAWRTLKDRMSMSEIARRFDRDHSTLRWNLIVAGAFEPSEKDIKNLPENWGGYHG